jgi:hypothetical protein
MSLVTKKNCSNSNSKGRRKWRLLSISPYKTGMKLEAEGEDCRK